MTHSGHGDAGRVLRRTASAGLNDVVIEGGANLPAGAPGREAIPADAAHRLTTVPGIARHRMGRGMELAHQSPRLVSGVDVETGIS